MNIEQRAICRIASQRPCRGSHLGWSKTHHTGVTLANGTSTYAKTASARKLRGLKLRVLWELFEVQIVQRRVTKLTMRVANIQLVSALLLIAAGTAHAASSWSFDDGRVSIVSKKDAEGSPEK
jgi:hypothetical protein